MTFAFRFALLLAALLVCQPALLAQPVPEGVDLRNLGLSPEQRTRIQEFRRTDQQAAAELRTGLNGEMQQLKSLYRSDANDEQLRSQFERVENYRLRLSRQRFENFLRIRSVLTPDQRTQIGSQLLNRPDKFMRGQRDRNLER